LRFGALVNFVHWIPLVRRYDDHNMNLEGMNKFPQQSKKVST